MVANAVIRIGRKRNLMLSSAACTALTSCSRLWINSINKMPFLTIIENNKIIPSKAGKAKALPKNISPHRAPMAAKGKIATVNNAIRTLANAATRIIVNNRIPTPNPFIMRALASKPCALSPASRHVTPEGKVNLVIAKSMSSSK